jgi:hypothetical protein
MVVDFHAETKAVINENSFRDSLTGYEKARFSEGYGL